MGSLARQLAPLGQRKGYQVALVAHTTSQTEVRMGSIEQGLIERTYPGAARSQGGCFVVSWSV